MTRARATADTQDNNGGAVPPFVGAKNVLINGQMDFWQRGISFSSVFGGYTADRWVVDNAASATRQAGTGVFTYCLRLTNTSTNPAIRQGIELPATGSAGLFTVGSTWTVSFFARTSTSISSPLAFFAAFADVNGAGASADTIVSALNIGASSTSWTRYSHTFTVNVAPGATRTCVQIVPYLAAGAYTGNFDITGIQLEAGSVATPFSRAGGTLAGELQACQRYYNRIVSGTDLTFGNGYAINTTQFEGNINFPIMRVAPTLIASSGTNYYKVRRNGGDSVFDSLIITFATTQNALLYTSTTAVTAGAGGIFVTNNALASVALSAEL